MREQHCTLIWSIFIEFLLTFQAVPGTHFELPAPIFVITTIFRSKHILQVRRRSCCCCSKKSLNASRPSEHPRVRGENVKTFRWDNRLQRQNKTSSWHLNLLVVVYLILVTDPLRIQPWSQDRTEPNQIKPGTRSEKNRESRQTTTDKKVASKGHRRQEGTQKRQSMKINQQETETHY